jgi:hypothetical protein
MNLNMHKLVSAFLASPFWRTFCCSGCQQQALIGSSKGDAYIVLTSAVTVYYGLVELKLIFYSMLNLSVDGEHWQGQGLDSNTWLE